MYYMIKKYMGFTVQHPLTPPRRRSISQLKVLRYHPKIKTSTLQATIARRTTSFKHRNQFQASKRSRHVAVLVIQPVRFTQMCV